jgi:S1-C subfamily serine protease
VSRRAFSGYWEYHLDEALFTTPARRDHSGAALFNARGELVGIGSLVVGDAEGSGPPGTPGNLFVPTALLPPILSELRQQGSSRASRRAWLGLNCGERNGAVVVLRTSSDSPAEEAGLLPGDRIVAIDGVGVTSLAALWKALWSGGPPERAVRLQVQRQGLVQEVTVRAVDRTATLRRAEGI